MLAAAGVVLVLGALTAACRDEPVAPTQDQATLQTTQDQPSLHLGDGLGVRILHTERLPLREGIVHYRYDVATGPGPHDLIRLHRIVRERHPNRPIEAEEGIFLLPGAPQLFEDIFMSPLFSPATSWDHSVTVFLAQHDVDVWGMDYGWALVPAATTDFTFMRDWGLGREIQDAEKGLAVARSIRASTGQGFGKLSLSGFSYGVPIAYLVASDETQQPPGRRSVKGIVPIEGNVKAPDEATRLANCSAAVSDQKDYLDQGVYQLDNSFFKQVGELALSAPDAVSPFYPPLTNWQFVLYVYTSDDGGGHFLGGYIDASGVPTGLRFTDLRFLADLLHEAGQPPYNAPVRVWVDLEKLDCNGNDVPFDDHLGDITIPILYIGAAGGFNGKSGYYSTTLTSSRDITKFVVQLLPDDQRAYDFGHADPFWARNAERLVWQPILSWINAHRSHHELAEAGR